MINAFINEIEMCLEKGFYMSALALCLILPDMCGKAEYPDKTHRDRYISWFDKYATPDYPYDRDEMPYINGQIIYDLRNNVIHSGDPDLNDKKSNIQKFELLVQESGRACYSGTSSTVVSHFEGIDEIVDYRSITISLRDLCTIVCLTAKKYYKENKNKFRFKYNVVNMDQETYDKMIIGGHDRRLYKNEEDDSKPS